MSEITEWLPAARAKLAALQLEADQRRLAVRAAQESVTTAAERLLNARNQLDAAQRTAERQPGELADRQVANALMAVAAGEQMLAAAKNAALKAGENGAGLGELTRRAEKVMAQIENALLANQLEV